MPAIKTRLATPADLDGGRADWAALIVPRSTAAAVAIRLRRR